MGGRITTGGGPWPPGHVSRWLGGGRAGGDSALTVLQRRGKAQGLPLGLVDLPVLVAWPEAARGGTATTAGDGDGTASDDRAALAGSGSTEVRQS
jgi:hypothetical protein